MINLDRNNIYYDGSAIEFCDILISNNELIHVKKWYNSSTLSDLFSQGRISGELLLRTKCLEKVVLRKT